MREAREETGTFSKPDLSVYVAGALAVLAALAWSYKDVLGDLWYVWGHDDNYSSGMLVPFLAAYVLFARRKDLAGTPIGGNYWGIGIIAAAFAMKTAGTIMVLGSAERLSLVVAVVGITLTVFGLRLLRNVGWILAFLLLMLPWPHRVHQTVALPLQDWATTSSVFTLETLGWIVEREGNIIRIGDMPLAVAEACSGLRMLTAFMVVSALLALVVKRAWWEKAIIVVSSVPIAVACNTMRLTATAIAYTAHYGDAVNKWFHDFGGFAMMPLALGFLALEMWVLRLLAPAAETEETGRKASARRQGNRQ